MHVQKIDLLLQLVRISKVIIAIAKSDICAVAQGKQSLYIFSMRGMTGKIHRADMGMA